MEVAVLGLGEAGARIAADLAAAGCAVRGWDPARRPEEIVNADSDRSAVEGADVVLSLNAGSVALDVARGVADVLGGDTLYVDLNTASPCLKQELAAAVPVDFVDGTGSGDAFVAGYIHGLLMGADAVSCLQYGSALGASCVRGMGATSGVLSARELDEFVKERPLAIRKLSQ